MTKDPPPKFRVCQFDEDARPTAFLLMQAIEPGRRYCRASVLANDPLVALPVTLFVPWVAGAPLLRGYNPVAFLNTVVLRAAMPAPLPARL